MCSAVDGHLKIGAALAKGLSLIEDGAPTPLSQRRQSTVFEDSPTNRLRQSSSHRNATHILEKTGRCLTPGL